MAEDFDYKKPLQDHFSDGLAIVVGSGLSCAEGLAGMGELTAFLNSTLPSQLSSDQLSEWETLSQAIAEKGLEPALMEQEPSDNLDAAIGEAVVQCLVPQEDAVIAEVLSGQRTLRFSKLIPHIRKDSTGVPILTTNYDRLIEVACEAAGLHVDTMFDGGTLGQGNAKSVREGLIRITTLVGGKLRRQFRPHARVFKPHGSMDWYQTPQGPVRFVGGLALPRMIITPGRRKLRKGYDRPFDEHRETLNRLLKKAARLMVIGYGFNDDHLETRITDLIQQGLPTLIMARSLSARALELATKNPSVIALDQDSETHTRMIFQGNAFSLPIGDLWDLGKFVDEVLSP